jgi:hypothetical protein
MEKGRQIEREIEREMKNEKYKWVLLKRNVGVRLKSNERTKNDMDERERETDW